jgi:6-phosphogluconate dehydrogenase
MENHGIYSLLNHLIKKSFESKFVFQMPPKSCSWIGLDISGNPTSSEGAGHFVKTVHNGIGYADMQLLAEAYHLMRDVLNMDLTEIAEVGSLVNNTQIKYIVI